jgi:hypothetical protein
MVHIDYIRAMRLQLPVIVALALAATIPLVFAEGATNLPGVKNDHRIVQPAAEPEPDDEPSKNSPTHFWVGKTEVKIKGELRFDVTAGDERIRPNPNR